MLVLGGLEASRGSGRGQAVGRGGGQVGRRGRGGRGNGRQAEGGSRGGARSQQGQGQVFEGFSQVGGPSHGRGAGRGGHHGQADRQHEAGPPGGREANAVRARAWVFTINNYRDVPKALPRGSPKVKYLCFGKEVSEKGTSHLQGYVYFENAVKQPSEVFKHYGNGHFAAARGTAEDNIKYCSKGGEFFEFGERPQSQSGQGHHGSKGGKKEVGRWEEAWRSAKKGKIEEVPADIRLRYYSTLNKVAAKYAKPPAELENLENTWIVGPSGSGKSTYIHRKYPGAFKKDFSRWWDGFQEDNVDHQTVLLDDLHPKWAEKERLKNWADRFPFQAEYKGGYMIIRPARIVVTSNYTPQQAHTDFLLPNWKDLSPQNHYFISWVAISIIRCSLKSTLSQS